MGELSTGRVPRLWLASSSPRRRDLLGALNVAFDVAPADVDEAPLPGESPSDLARRLSKAKAAAVDGDLVIGADTVVAAGQNSLGKPSDSAEARMMLKRLAAEPRRRHTVCTGVAVRMGDRIVTEVAQAAVYMGSLTDELVEWYLRSGEWEGKAGGYALQGQGGRLVERIDGHPQTVIGLPVFVVDELLSRLGFGLSDFMGPNR